MRAFSVALIVSCMAVTSAMAELNDPAGEKAMHDYVLTMPKVKAYDAATNAADAAMKADPSLKAELDKSDNEPDKTIADLRAKMDHHPRIFAFYAKQGLSKDDAILTPLSLMSACTVAQYPQIAAKMASSVSASQIAFCKANLPALKKMRFFAGGSE